MHTISGLIRRAPHIQQGQNSNGSYTMFCFELSEYIKGNNGEDATYTNYSVALFAKTTGAIEFHTKAIAENAFVVVNCDKLKVDKQTGNNGTEYIKLKMMNASLSDFNNPNQQQQAPQQQQNAQPQYQQQQAPQHQQQAPLQGQYIPPQQQAPAPQQQQQPQSWGNKPQQPGK